MRLRHSQLLSGQNLIGQGVQFLQRAGIDTEASFSVNMGLNSVSPIALVHRTEAEPVILVV
jgi:SP family general alpha glucoside:H+ symporter-like MFS transporter